MSLSDKTKQWLRETCGVSLTGKTVLVTGANSGGGEHREPAKAVNDWWGMDSGVIDVLLTGLVPPGVRALAELLTERLKAGALDIFRQEVRAQDGSLIADGSRSLSSLEILQMDRLCDAVEGRIPEYGELLPMSRALVRELGVHRDAVPPDAEE